jgi:NADH:ubiquinone oxidoreductase subunit 3 (subunit A)
MTDEKIVNSLYLDNWPRRRAYLAAALGFLAGNIEYLILFGDTVTDRDLALALLASALSLLFAYIFGAVWDDKNKMVTLPQITAAPTPPKDQP